MILDHTQRSHCKLPQRNNEAMLCCSQLNDVLLSINRMCPLWVFSPVREAETTWLCQRLPAWRKLNDLCVLAWWQNICISTHSGKCSKDNNYNYKNLNVCQMHNPNSSGKRLNVKEVGVNDLNSCAGWQKTISSEVCLGNLVKIQLLKLTCTLACVDSQRSSHSFTDRKALASR